VAHAVAQTDRASCLARGQSIAARPRAREGARVDPYLVTRLAGQADEMLLCLFYDNDGAFTAERSWKGTPSSVTAERRELMFAVVAHDARYVVMAHNHPSGTAWPSAQDIAATRQMHRLLAALGVILADHAIVANDGLVFSFRLAGLV
jgi:DNA repair protein RadC